MILCLRNLHPRLCPPLHVTYMKDFAEEQKLPAPEPHNPEFKSLKVYMASHLPETVLCPVDQTSSMEGSKVIETAFHLPIHTFSIIFI